MRTVRVELGERSYPIEIGEGLLGALGERTAADLSPSSVIVVTDSNVGPLYLDAALESLRGAGLTAAGVTLPAGEDKKSLAAVSGLYDRLFERYRDIHAQLSPIYHRDDDG